MAKKSTRFSLGGWLKHKALEFITDNGSLNQGLYGEIRYPLNGISLAGMRISVDSLYTVWRNHGDVFACVREIKENVGSQGYTWLNVKDENADPDITQIKIAEAALNYGGSFNDLKDIVMQDTSIAGNCYLLIQHSAGDGSTILGFDRIDPRTISVVMDQYGTIFKWIQRVNGLMKEYLPSEVLHFKETDDPNSPVFGLSPLEPIIWETRTDLSAMISNFAFFANDATPGAQYILEDGISEEDKAKVVEDIRSQLKGAENRNKSTILRGVKEIKTLQISQKDMEFNLLRRFTTEKICAAFGVPKAILNYTDGVNYANGEEQTKKFWEGTINPKQNRWEKFINTKILPMLGLDGIKIDYNSKVFEDKHWDEASTRADQQQGVLSLNEVREKRGYATLDPIVHGEWVNKPLIWNGATVKPLSDIGIEQNPDGTPAIVSEDQATKEIDRIERMANLYTRNNKEKVDKGFDLQAKNLIQELFKDA